jgi:hypothetical protein
VLCFSLLLFRFMPDQLYISRAIALNSRNSLKLDTCPALPRNPLRTLGKMLRG